MAHRTDGQGTLESVVGTTAAAVEAVVETATATVPWTVGNRLLGYDPKMRRLWIGGQRLHHGLTGCAVAGVGLFGVAARRTALSRGAAYAVIGAVLMAHDWKDRSAWFRLGRQHPR